MRLRTARGCQPTARMLVGEGGKCRRIAGQGHGCVARGRLGRASWWSIPRTRSFRYPATWTRRRWVSHSSAPGDLDQATVGVPVERTIRARQSSASFERNRVAGQGHRYAAKADLDVFRGGAFRHAGTSDQATEGVRAPRTKRRWVSHFDPPFRSPTRRIARPRRGDPCGRPRPTCPLRPGSGTGQARPYGSSSRRFRTRHVNHPIACSICWPCAWTSSTLSAPYRRRSWAVVLLTISSRQMRTAAINGPGKPRCPDSRPWGCSR